MRMRSFPLQQYIPRSGFKFYGFTILSKKFSKVPGPRRLPLIGNLHLFSRFGPYSFDKLYEAYEDLYNTYGSVVRLELGISMLLLFDPSLIESILDLSDRHPDRPPIEALKHHRLKNKDKYGSAGLVSENGEEWKRLRGAANFMMSPKFAQLYLSAQEEIADDFTKRISRTRNSQGLINDFLRELYLFTQESIGLVCFGVRLGLMDESKSNAEWSSRISQASEDTLQSFADTLVGLPLWKFMKTTPYKKLEESQDFFHKFATECLNKAKSRIQDPSSSNDVTLEFSRTLLSQPGIDSKDISLLMTEIFSTGIDSTANQIGFTLFNLARNPDVQEKLYQEIKTHAPLVHNLTKSAMDKMTYYRACIKESYRLTPTSGGTARVLKRSLEMGGYSIPANVICLGVNPVICRLPEYYVDPLQFIPERWLDRSDLVIRNHPFNVLPYGNGVRRCIGQRFAEQEIRLCIVKILQKYRVKYNGPDIGRKMRLLIIPDKPLDFVFEDRS